MRLFNSIVLPGQPPIPETDGLVLYVDPTNVGSVNVSGGVVQSIRNQVSGIPLTILGAGPTLGTIGGATSLTFDGATTALASTEAAVIAALQANSPCTIYVVHQTSNPALSQAFLGCGSTVGANARRYWGLNSSTKWAMTTIEDIGTSTAHLGEQLSDTNPHVFIATVNGGTSVTFAVDDIANDPDSETDTPGVCNLTRFALGCYPAHVPTQFWLDDIGLVLVYNVNHTEAQQKSIYDWILANRYQIGLILPQPTIDPNKVYWMVKPGQSNASGQGDRPARVPAGRMMWADIIGVTSPGTLVPLGPYSGNLHGSELRCVTLFANQGLTLESFTCAKGTTGLFSYWAPPVSGGPHTGWDILVADLATALPLVQALYPGKTIVPIVAYDQCEYEQQNVPSGGSEAVNYGTYMIQFIDAIRALPGMAGAIFTMIEAHTFPAADVVNTGLVQSGQALAVASRSDVYLIPSDQFQTYAGALHYNSQGLSGPPHTQDWAFEWCNLVLGLL